MEQLVRRAHQIDNEDEEVILGVLAEAQAQDAAEENAPEESRTTYMCVGCTNDYPKGQLLNCLEDSLA